MSFNLINLLSCRVRIIPHDEYYCGLFYYTGSTEFNHQIRKYAHKKGFILNEYSLRRKGTAGKFLKLIWLSQNSSLLKSYLLQGGKPGKPLKITCEKDIFDYLGLEYKNPEERSI